MKKPKKPLLALSKKEQIVGTGAGKEDLNPRTRAASTKPLKSKGKITTTSIQNKKI